jgi:tRNA nucleotidyltransferase (CCA-adding enzyme)
MMLQTISDLPFMQTIKKAGGKSFIVGGTVRDFLLGVEGKDIDIEVFNLPYYRLPCLLSEYGQVDEVGKSFGVIKFKHRGIEYDFSLPRSEKKTGSKHTDYEVVYDPFLNPERAASRRDYTINAMMLDPFTMEIHDFFGGQDDLRNKILRATSEAFKEDSLRALRGMQIASRFNLTVEEKTAKMCKELGSEYKDIHPDRIWIEWKKWGLMSTKPSAGLQFLIDCGWSKFYPEFHNIIGVQQNPIFHPEGEVHTHTMMVCDAGAEIASKENLSDIDRLILMFSCLTHDISKATHSQGTYPRITSRGHETASGPMSTLFLYRINAPEFLHLHVPPLVRNHMAYLSVQSDKAVRKLAERLEPSNINMLCHLINSDYSGRDPLPKGLPPKAKSMLEIANREKVTYNKPKQIIVGKVLQDMLMSSGPEFGKIIKEAYKAQLEGKFKTIDEGKKWVTNNLSKIL